LKKKTNESGPTSCTSTNNVRVLGGGPAGSMAAIGACREGAARVEIVERSRFPRHKVCGEFLSPEIAPILQRAGLLEAFLQQAPWSVRRMAVYLGSTEKRAVLPEPAFGLSRYTFDELLWSTAARLGTQHVGAGEPTIIATGRPPSPAAKGSRLFGFKAHFDGPSDDAVELYFRHDAYVGINCIEGGRTNVCGIAPESALKAAGFEPESLMMTSAPLRHRLAPLTRTMDWIFTGPLAFGQRWKPEGSALLCGDALSFVDPFTGSGLLCAALTGSLAGEHAARGLEPAAHLAACRKAIGRPFFFSSALRSIAGTDWAERLLPFVPGQWLYRLTRPPAVRVSW